MATSYTEAELKSNTVGRPRGGTAELADEVKTTEDRGYEQRTILIYTDGSKN
jgi:hypothetical protein